MGAFVPTEPPTITAHPPTRYEQSASPAGQGPNITDERVPFPLHVAVAAIRAQLGNKTAPRAIRVEPPGRNSSPGAAQHSAAERNAVQRGTTRYNTVCVCVCVCVCVYHVREGARAHVCGCRSRRTKD